ncbi:23S rRNA (guanosine(2251)-2'-O)-methyltransferase RlmB [Desulfococcaceae bacterium HSG7]|nr:23S rRNA (guanosine(2251)-2'-O)-methyltransferase RlmB [Desulfococcaceae bacterium HSG7]
MKNELLFGIHSVSEALRAGRRQFIEIYTIRTKPSKRIKAVLEMAARRQIPIRMLNSNLLDKMAGNAFHQGIGAKVSPYPFTHLNVLIDKTDIAGEAPFLLMLDHVTDARNMGALVRTAVCAGVTGIITTKDRAAPITAAVCHASAGAVEHAQIARVTNMVTTIKALKQSGLWIAGLDKAARQSVFEQNLSGPLAVVIGSEEKGIRPLVKKNCDFLLAIPQQGAVDSLNASVAGGIVMYEIFRQRILGN